MGEEESWSLSCHGECLPLPGLGCFPGWDVSRADIQKVWMLDMLFPHTAAGSGTRCLFSPHGQSLLGMSGC